MKLNNASTPLRRSARLAAKTEKTEVASTTPTKKSPRQKERNDASGDDKTPDHRPARTAGDRACQSTDGKSKREKKQQALMRAKRWSTERKPMKATGVDGAVVDELNNYMQRMNINQDEKDRIRNIALKFRGAATNKSTGVARNLQFGDEEDDVDDHSVKSDESSTPQAEAYVSTEPVPSHAESRSDASSSDEDSTSSSDEERNDDSSYVPEDTDDSFDWDFQKDEPLGAGKPSSSSETSGTSYSYSYTAGLPDTKVDLGSDRNKAAVEGNRKRQEKAQEEAEAKEYAEQKRQEKKAAEEKRQAKMKEQADTIARVLSATSHYSVLFDNVNSTSSTSDVRKAYRNLALVVHPDKNTLPGAEDAFKAVQAAYDVLNCPTKRAEYDRKYQSRFKRTTPQPPPPQPKDVFTSFADEIPIGTKVTFCNLNSASSYLQGQQGFVMGFSKASKQYKIKMNNFNSAFGGDFIIDADVGTFFQNVEASTRWYTSLKSTYGVASVTVDSYREQDGIYEVHYRFGTQWLRPNEILIPIGTIVRLHGLHWSPEHNGKYGKIFQFHEERKRTVNSCVCGQLCAVCDASYYTVQIARSTTSLHNHYFVNARMENMRL